MLNGESKIYSFKWWIDKRRTTQLAELAVAEPFMPDQVFRKIRDTAIGGSEGGPARAEWPDDLEPGDRSGGRGPNQQLLGLTYADGDPPSGDSSEAGSLDSDSGSSVVAATAYRRSTGLTAGTQSRRVAAVETDDPSLAAARLAEMRIRYNQPSAPAAIAGRQRDSSRGYVSRYESRAAESNAGQRREEPGRRALPSGPGAVQGRLPLVSRSPRPLLDKLSRDIPAADRSKQSRPGRLGVVSTTHRRSSRSTSLRRGRFVNVAFATGYRARQSSGAQGQSANLSPVNEQAGSAAAAAANEPDSPEERQTTPWERLSAPQASCRDADEVRELNDDDDEDQDPVGRIKICLPGGNVVGPSSGIRRRAGTGPHYPQLAMDRRLPGPGRLHFPLHLESGDGMNDRRIAAKDED